MRRIARTGLVALIAICMVALLAPSAALAADSGAEADFVSRINSERTSRGLSKLVVASDLVKVAREHSAEMARENDLYHNPNLGSDVTNWRSVGENVGRGPGVSTIHNAFMASSGHKANILSSSWVEVGVGVVVVDGQMWVTEIFRLPKTSSPDPEPEPEPEPDSEPAPKPKAKATSEPEPVKTSETAPAPAPKPASTPPAPATAPAPEPEPTPVPALADVMLRLID